MAEAERLLLADRDDLAEAGARRRRAHRGSCRPRPSSLRARSPCRNNRPALDLPRPVTKIICSIPASRASSTAYWISGRSTTVSISLGMVLVAGSRRVPSPATGKIALRTGLVIGAVRPDCRGRWCSASRARSVPTGGGTAPPSGGGRSKRSALRGSPRLIEFVDPLGLGLRRQRQQLLGGQRAAGERGLLRQRLARPAAQGRRRWPQAASARPSATIARRFIISPPARRSRRAPRRSPRLPVPARSRQPSGARRPRPRPTGAAARARRCAGRSRCSSSRLSSSSALPAASAAATARPAI